MLQMISAEYSYDGSTFMCGFDRTKRLCNDTRELRHMRVDDIEHKAFEIWQGNQ